MCIRDSSGRDHAVLDELGNTVLYGHPDAQAIFTRIQVENDSLLILRNTVEGERPVGFASYRAVSSTHLDRWDQRYPGSGGSRAYGRVTRKSGGAPL